MLHAVVQALAMGRRPELVDNAEASHVFSSFSDHAILSLPYDAADDYTELLFGVGRMQVGIAAMGCFIRGAITIGDLYHDREVVFGPGLVRAYDLETNVAQFPRVIVDPDVEELAQLQMPFVTLEGGIRFIDPFTETFVAAAIEAPRPTRMMEAYAELTGFTQSGSNSTMAPAIALRAILELLRIERLSTSSERALEKLDWLIGRLEMRVGHVHLTVI